MSKLKTLEDHNIQAETSFYDLNSNKPRPNGIECPNCKNELVDSNPMVVLTSYPPQVDISCEKCEYRGYRVK